MKQGRLKMRLWGEDSPPTGQLPNLTFSDKLSVWGGWGRWSDSFADMQECLFFPVLQASQACGDVDPGPLGENQLVLSAHSGSCSSLIRSLASLSGLGSGGQASPRLCAPGIGCLSRPRFLNFTPAPQVSVLQTYVCCSGTGVCKPPEVHP